MILAAIDGDWIVPLVVVVIGFLNWLSNRLSGNKDQPASPGQPRPVAPRPTARESSEEERMRKFLEALGVPANTEATSPRPPPLPPERPQARQAPQRRSARERRQVQPEAREPRPRPAVAAPPPELPSLDSGPSLDSLSEPTLPVERLILPELNVPAVAEFETVSSQVGATGRGGDSTAPAVADLPRRSDDLRRALASKDQLRSAFLVREILGLPRSLQS